MSINRINMLISFTYAETPAKPTLRRTAVANAALMGIAVILVVLSAQFRR